jgi:hypothetical protein
LKCVKIVSVWNKKYYRYIYDKLLKEIGDSIDFYTYKWKRDLLLMLLEMSNDTGQTRKALRKKMQRDVEDAEAIAYEKEIELSETEED